MSEQVQVVMASLLLEEKSMFLQGVLRVEMEDKEEMLF
jgi:hypothetical protein